MKRTIFIEYVDYLVVCFGACEDDIWRYLLQHWFRNMKDAKLDWARWMSSKQVSYACELSHDAKSLACPRGWKWRFWKDYNTRTRGTHCRKVKHSARCERPMFPRTYCKHTAARHVYKCGWCYEIKKIDNKRQTLDDVCDSESLSESLLSSCSSAVEAARLVFHRTFFHSPSLEGVAPSESDDATGCIRRCLAFCERLFFGMVNSGCLIADLKVIVQDQDWIRAPPALRSIPRCTQIELPGSLKNFKINLVLH